MQTAHLDQITLFEMKRFHNLIHYFRWPKKDFLSLSELSEIFMVCANHHSREVPVQKPAKPEFNEQVLDWEGIIDSPQLFYTYEWKTNAQIVSSAHRWKGKQKRRDGDHAAASCRSAAEPLDQSGLLPTGQAAQVQAVPMGSYRCCCLHSKDLSLLSVCNGGQYGIALLVHKIYWRNSDFMVVFWVRQNWQTLNQVKFKKIEKAEAVFISLSYPWPVDLKKILDIPFHMDQHALSISVLIFWSFQFK